MVTGFEIDPDERTDLKFMICHKDSDTDLVEHYRTAEPMYKGFLNTILGLEFKVLNEDKKTYHKENYGTNDIIELLTDTIKKFDKKLRGLYRIKATRERIDFKHSYVCELFAKNTLAKNPVKVRK